MILRLSFLSSLLSPPLSRLGLFFSNRLCKADAVEGRKEKKRCKEKRGKKNRYMNFLDPDNWVC